MPPIRLGGIVTVLLLILASGCHKEAAPPPAGPQINAMNLSEIRATYAKVDPSAVVGTVAAVDPANRLAAVGDVDSRMFHLGQSITFVDSHNMPLVNGQVTNLTQFVNVKYETPGKNHRAPQVGDLAVRFGGSK